LNIVVLLKQVPDISNIPADAWNHETGTLKRAMLDNVLNPFDFHAITCACRLRDSLPGGARVVCLTMGIKTASEILLDAMSRGADEGILLTDPVFAGADTSATARTLALAIRKIERELFDGNREYLVVAGMQSVDGDTAQVPGQVSEALGVDLVAYVAGVDYGKSPAFRRITSSGLQAVQLTRYPAVLTMTDCTEPLYPSFARCRRVRTRPDAFRVWTAEDLNADAEAVGGKGSWTQVVRIFSPLQEGRNCRYARDAAELVSLMTDALQKTAKPASHDHPGTTSRPEKPAYSGPVLVYAERSQDGLAPVVYELLSEARGLAAVLGETVGAVLVGARSEVLSRELIARGADSVYYVVDSQAASNDSMALCSAVADVVNKYEPQIMLFGATPHGRELAPRVAYATASGLTADCTHLSIGDHGGKEAVLLQTRPALGGNIMATIVSKSCRTQMATVRPGVFVPAVHDAQRKGSVVEHKCAIRTGSLKVISADAPLPKTELVTAELIVTGGAGMHSVGNFERYLRPLAAALGERFSLRATVGASRRAVEHSYARREMQVGQTGQTVGPAMYVAIGVSGAVQHISAIQKSRVIVAINPDPKAPIFRTADVGIVGKAETVIPRMLEVLESKVHGE